jgi:large repetitive protein
VLVTVHDAAGASAIAEVHIAILPATLVIETEDLPDGEVGVPYEGQLSASGGFGQQTWTVLEGAIPPGLTVFSESLSGPRLSGTPTLAGSYTFTLMVQDEIADATREFTVEIE